MVSVLVIKDDLLGKKLYWYHGFILMLLYVVYAVYMIIRSKRKNKIKNKKKIIVKNLETTNIKQKNIYGIKHRTKAFLKIDLEHAVIGNKNISKYNSLSLLAISTIILSAFSWFLVYSIEKIGKHIGIHGFFIAVIFAAAASSIPDTILSIKDTKKGNYDDAIANAFGSNIFDICFALGTPLFLYTLINGPILVNPKILDNVTELRILLLILTILTFLILFFSKNITKKTSLILLLMYIFFTVFIIGSAYDLKYARFISEHIKVIQNLFF